MNLETFKQALEALTDADWQAVLDGAGIVVEQDAKLSVGNPDQAFVLYELGEETFPSAEALKQALLAQAEALWNEYYQYNPFSKQGFYRKARAAMEQVGITNFVSTPKSPSSHRLFVEGAEVVAIDQSSPMFKYAFHCQIDQELNPTALTNKANNWLNSGAAYEEYICVNVCRFGSKSLD